MLFNKVSNSDKARLYLRGLWDIKIQNRLSNYIYLCAFAGSSDGEEPACQCRRCRVHFQGEEDPLEEGMATHSSILA